MLAEGAVGRLVREAILAGEAADEVLLEVLEHALRLANLNFLARVLHLHAGELLGHLVLVLLERLFPLSHELVLELVELRLLFRLQRLRHGLQLALLLRRELGSALRDVLPRDSLHKDAAQLRRALVVLLAAEGGELLPAALGHLVTQRLFLALLAEVHHAHEAGHVVLVLLENALALVVAQRGLRIHQSLHDAPALVLVFGHLLLFLRSRRRRLRHALGQLATELGLLPLALRRHDRLELGDAVAVLRKGRLDVLLSRRAADRQAPKRARLHAVEQLGRFLLEFLPHVTPLGHVRAVRSLDRRLHLVEQRAPLLQTHAHVLAEGSSGGLARDRVRCALDHPLEGVLQQLRLLLGELSLLLREEQRARFLEAVRLAPQLFLGFGGHRCIEPLLRRQPTREQHRLLRPRATETNAVVDERKAHLEQSRAAHRPRVRPRDEHAHLLLHPPLGLAHVPLHRALEVLRARRRVPCLRCGLSDHARLDVVERTPHFKVLVRSHAPLHLAPLPCTLR
eukprot:Opistho-1_new@104277